MKLTRDRSRHPWLELEDVDYFSFLSHDALRQASRYVDRVEVAEGARLQRQGMAARWVWIPTRPSSAMRTRGR